MTRLSGAAEARRGNLSPCAPATTAHLLSMKSLAASALAGEVQFGSHSNDCTHTTPATSAEPPQLCFGHSGCLKPLHAVHKDPHAGWQRPRHTKGWKAGPGTVLDWITSVEWDSTRSVALQSPTNPCMKPSCCDSLTIPGSCGGGPPSAPPGQTSAPLPHRRWGSSSSAGCPGR